MSNSLLLLDRLVPILSHKNVSFSLRVATAPSTKNPVTILSNWTLSINLYDAYSLSLGKLMQYLLVGLL